MKKLAQTTRLWCSRTAILAAAAALAVACSKPSTEPKPPTGEKAVVTIPTLAEITGGWEADSRRWDISDGKGGICYLMNEAGNDYAFDENGDYITITLLEYLQQYAADYNADENNTIKGTPEDFAYQPYENSYMFSNFGIDATKIKVYHGQRIADAGTMSIECVNGTYTYDPITGLMTIEDVSIVTDPRTVKMKVWKETYADQTSRICYQYSDYDIFVNKSYDKKIIYDTYASTIYYTESAEPFKPSDEAPAQRSVRFVK